MNKLILTMTCAVALSVTAAPPPGGPKGPAKRPQPQAHQGQPPKAAKPAPHVAPQKPKPAPQARPKPAPQAKPKPAPARGPQPKQKWQMQKSHHQMDARGAGRYAPPPHHNGFHAGRPAGARFWGRPALPPRMHGALRDWAWVATPWSYYVDGVYYYGEGYYFDGYNYCYNGGYHLVPPPIEAAIVPGAVVAQPVVTPVVAQPVVAPVATTVVTPPPPPPPPRRRGLLNLLFGD